MKKHVDASTVTGKILRRISPAYRQELAEGYARQLMRLLAMYSPRLSHPAGPQEIIVPDDHGPDTQLLVTAWNVRIFELTDPGEALLADVALPDGLTPERIDKIRANVKRGQETD